MVDHLGLYEDALHWWQRCREAAPLESVPIVEQTTILSDLGMYVEARDRLSALFEEKNHDENIQEEPSNDLKEFGVDSDSPDLFSSESENSSPSDLLNSEDQEDEDDLEIPAFLRRQKN